MKRGAVSSAILVLSAVAIVGVLAAVTLTAWQPTGLVMQNQAVYISEHAALLALNCRNSQQVAYFLGYTGQYAEFCCAEDMYGQNDCKYPQKILFRINQRTSAGGYHGR
ncbi:MAG: hypothetical protein QW165_03090 [Candidatus Woesearchaeota archaeon]